MVGLVGLGAGCVVGLGFEIVIFALSECKVEWEETEGGWVVR